MMRKNKKAVSHIEMILSFIIFISFLVFLLMIFPLQNLEKSSIGLDYAEKGILNYTKMNVEYVGISLNDTAIELIDQNKNQGNKECFLFPTNLNLGKVIVKNESDDIINASSFLLYEGTDPQNGDITILNVVAIKGKERFYRIYSSPEFAENSFDVSKCQVIADYNPPGKKYLDTIKMGLVREHNVLSYNRIVNFTDRYNAHYKELISEFEMPKNENFGFNIVDLNGQMIAQASKKIPSRVRVLAREYPVEIFYQNGSSRYGVLTTYNW